MANYKRRKARIKPRRTIRGSHTSWRAKNKLKPVVLNRGIEGDAFTGEICFSRDHSYKSPLNSWPKWWDLAFNTRPKRRENRVLEKKIIKGSDPDELVWPLGNHKPHTYYW